MSKQNNKIFTDCTFSSLPPLPTALVLHLELRISLQIFPKIWNSPNRILRGLGKLIHEKTWSKKSPCTVSLNFQSPPLRETCETRYCMVMVRKEPKLWIQALTSKFETYWKGKQWRKGVNLFWAKFQKVLKIYVKNEIFDDSWEMSTNQLFISSSMSSRERTTFQILVGEMWITSKGEIWK